MKPLFILSALFLCLVKPSQAQYVLYTNDTIPLYPPAANPRYSAYKTVSFDIVMPATSIDSLLNPTHKSNTTTRKEFLLSIGRALTNAGLTIAPDSATDLKIIYTPTLTGTLQKKVLDKSNTTIFDQQIPNTSHIYSNKPVTDTFLRYLDGPQAIATYSTIVRNLIYWAYYRRQTFIADFYDTPIQLASITNSKEKYPKLKSLDSINKKLIDTLHKQLTKDYTYFIKPFEQGYKNILNNTDGFSEAKVAIYSNLTFLYYLAVDTASMDYALDSLYTYSSEVFGARVDYDKRAPLEQEIDDLAQLRTKRKIPLPGMAKDYTETYVQ